MPVTTVVRKMKTVRKSIRQHWSDEEKLRRREMAGMMQLRLLTLLHTNRGAGASG